MGLTVNGWVGKSNIGGMMRDDNSRGEGYTWDRMDRAQNILRSFPGGILVRVTIHGKERRMERLGMDGTWQGME
jgi:hypothetical protein